MKLNIFPLPKLKEEVPGGLIDFNRILRSLQQLFDGRISIAADGTTKENLDVDFVEVADTGTANTEFAVAHALGRVPVGYMVTKKSIAGDIYTSTGGTAWTSSNIYLKCASANSAITVMVF